ncbi:MAG: AbrB/MazE/SpoVT family DNA-binding domain-containing protein [archaeon]|nr:AbrB/MazE/SpoVT family DNA-binding domain-containing protein [archaeon]
MIILEVSMTKVSSKGQVVIPQELREEANLKEGQKLLAYGDKDTIVLKKIDSSLAEFKKLSSFGRRFAKLKGIKKSDVLKDD